MAIFHRDFRLTLALPLFITCLALFGTYQLVRLSEQKNHTAQAAQFHMLSTQTVILLQERLNLLTHLLNAAHGFVVASEQITQAEWSGFFQTMNLDYQALGIAGIGYTHYLPHAQKRDYLHAMSQRLKRPFGIFPAGKRAHYFVITHITPDSQASRLLGYDIGVSPIRKQAALQAARTGHPTLSDPLTLINTSPRTSDYLMLRAIPSPAAGPPPAITGWVSIGINFYQLVDNVLADSRQQLHLRIIDPRISDPVQRVIYDNTWQDAASSRRDQRLRIATELQLGLQPLHLTLTPAPGTSPFSEDTGDELLIALIGTALSLALGVSAYLLLNSRALAVQTANRMISEHQESEARYRMLFNVSPEAIIIHQQGRIVQVNETCVQLLGAHSVEELIGRNVLDFVAPESRPAVVERLQRITEGPLPLLEECLLRSDGSRFYAEVVGAPVEYRGELATQVLVRDISERKEHQRESRITHAVFQSTSEAIMVSDAQDRIVLVNPAFTAITGYACEDVLNRKTTLLSSGYHDRAFFQALWQQLQQTGHWEGELTNRKRSGERYIQRTTISVVQDDSAQTLFYVWVFNDITEQKQLEASIRFQALHDNLTRLPNRVLLEDRAEQALKHAQRSQQQAAFLFIDLDRFKPINDTYGHLIGDQLLQAIAERLGKLVRASDTLARIGGDEFLLLAHPISNAEDACKLAHKLLAALQTPFRLAELELRIGASIGVALYPDHGHHVPQLIERADRAMYDAKHQGKGKVVLATPVTQALSGTPQGT